MLSFFLPIQDQQEVYCNQCHPHFLHTPKLEAFNFNNNNNFSKYIKSQQMHKNILNAIWILSKHTANHLFILLCFIVGSLFHQCINVCVNWWMLTFEWLGRLEKALLVHLSCRTVNQVVFEIEYDSRRINSSCSIRNSCLIKYTRPVWYNTIHFYCWIKILKTKHFFQKMLCRSACVVSLTPLQKTGRSDAGADNA